MDRVSTASSRPKTSQGRPPTSTRARPPSAAPNPNGGVARPPSRSISTRAEVQSSENVNGPSASINQIMRPPSQSQKIPSASGRPTTGMARPPSSVMRPTTQQGLRAPTRMGTSSTRQVFDKSYFVGILRAKINSMNVEIAKMADQRDKGERDRMELHAYELRAQEIAVEVRELQGRLIDLNVILDRMHVNGDIGDFEMEVSKVRVRAIEEQKAMEEIMKERQRKEEEMNSLQMEFDKQRELNNSAAQTMDSSTKILYEEKKIEAVNLEKKVAEMQEEKEELDATIAKYELDIRTNPMKVKAVELQNTVDTLKKRKNELLEEKKTQLTPEQKKNLMVENMKQLNLDIIVIDKQQEEVKEQLSIAFEELHEFDSHGEAQLVAHNNKYLELLNKSQMQEESLENFPEKVILIQQEMEEYSDAVVLNLRKISANLKKVNLGGRITDLDEGGLNMKSGNVNDLKDLHVRFQEELINLEDMLLAINEEFDTLKTEELQLNNELSNVGERTKVDTKGYESVLDDKKKHMDEMMPLKKQEVDVLEEQLRKCQDEMESELKNKQVLILGAELLEFEKRVNVKNEETAKRREDNEFEPIKNEALRLQKKYNEMLLENAGKQLIN